MKTIGVLVSTRREKPTYKRPIEHVSRPGLKLIFGSSLSKLDGQVFLENQKINALYDRFPSRILHRQYPNLSDFNVPIANPPSINRIFEDKVRTQSFLETHNIPMPELAISQFEEKMSEWNNLAIVKPRFGAFGTGVALSKSPPATTTTGLSGPEQTIIQQYIRSPFGYLGISIRQLVFRNADHSWFFPPPVARCSKTDVIVNASRGALLYPAAEILPDHTLTSILRLSQKVATALSSLSESEWLVEVGLDFVIDEEWNPWLIELNGQPKGRYRDLSEQKKGRWTQLHVDAISKPLTTILEWIS